MSEPQEEFPYGLKPKLDPAFERLGLRFEYAYHWLPRPMPDGKAERAWFRVYQKGITNRISLYYRVREDLDTGELIVTGPDGVLFETARDAFNGMSDEIKRRVALEAMTLRRPQGSLSFGSDPSMIPKTIFDAAGFFQRRFRRFKGFTFRTAEELVTAVEKRRQLVHGD